MKAVWCCCALLLSVGSRLAGQVPAAESVRQAELAFAKQAEDQGIRKAFLAWLKPEARVFTPQARTASEVYGPEPGDPGYLQWHPEANGVSSSGELAWSMGPWAYSVKRGDAPIVHGHFLSVWQKQPDGTWRVMADIGVPHAAPEPSIPVMAPAPMKSRSAPTESAGDLLSALRQTEIQLAAEWSKVGGSSLKPFLSREAQVYRPRHLPLHAGQDLDKLLMSEGPGGTWKTDGMRLETRGDLGWTSGETTPDPQGRVASFLRIWVREAGAWRVRFDVRLPHPPPKP